MGKQRAGFPYLTGHNVHLDVETLNLVVQVMIPTDSWTVAIHRIVKEWVMMTGARVVDAPTVAHLLAVRQEQRRLQVENEIAALELARWGRGESEHATHEL